MRRASLVGPVLLCLPSLLAAQTSAPLMRAAATITARDVAHRIGIIAHDSMMGRDTPSRGLDRTAQYVADEFRRFGLRPGGDDGSWFQRYSISRHRLDLERSWVVFTSEKSVDSAAFTVSARYDGGPIPDAPVSGPAILVGGSHTPESMGKLTLENRVALFLPPPGAEPEIVQQVLRILFLSGPRALVVVSSADSASFAATLPRHSLERTVVGTSTDRPVAIQVASGAISRPLANAGVDLAGIRGSKEPVIRELPGLTVTVSLEDSVTSSLMAPNT
jgi:hypothetical protein